MGRRWGRYLAYVVCAVAWLSGATEMAADGGAAPSSSAMCPASDAADLSVPHVPHVRPVNESIGAPLRVGIRRSRTLAELVDHIETLDGRVYLFAGSYRRLDRGLALRGGTSHQVTVTGSYRILKITVEPGMGDQTIATIGHELRHAIEILEVPDAVDVRSVGKLYERIGFLVSPGVYETDAARRAEHQVFDDLKHCRF